MKTPMDREDLAAILRGPECEANAADNGAAVDTDEKDFWEQVARSIDAERQQLEEASRRACGQVMARIREQPKPVVATQKAARRWSVRLPLAVAAGLLVAVGAGLAGWQALREAAPTDSGARVASVDQALPHPSLERTLAEAPEGTLIMLSGETASELGQGPLRISKPVRFSTQEGSVALGRSRG